LPAGEGMYYKYYILEKGSIMVPSDRSEIDRLVVEGDPLVILEGIFPFPEFDGILEDLYVHHLEILSKLLCPDQVFAVVMCYLHDKFRIYLSVIPDERFIVICRDFEIFPPPEKLEEVFLGFEDVGLLDVFNQATIMRMCGMLACAKGKRGKKKPSSRPVEPQNRQITVVKQRICPDTMRVPVRFRETGQAFNNAAVAYATGRWAVNNWLNVNPSVGSTIPGKTYLLALYSMIRILKCRVKVTFVNLEAFALTVCAYPQGGTIDPGANSNAVQQIMEDQPRARVGLCGPVQGQNRVTLTFPWMDMVKISGYNAAATGDNYAMFSGAPPTDFIYFVYGMRSTGGAVVLVNGATIEATIDFVVECSGRNTIVS